MSIHWREPHTATNHGRLNTLLIGTIVIALVGLGGIQATRPEPPLVPCGGDLDCALKNPGRCETGGIYCLTDAEAQAILDRMTPADREYAIYGNDRTANHVRRDDCADEVVHRADYYTPKGNR